ncbi:hypothetical protein HYPSUDRAFT_914066 [Hypholoma sublateritium FD-334 SS-4]|uniref:Uncharacterized protein n=1 Tax=Hypholoma sublateritium (strain FD-334 SS-4) TaxID=945553 RepID=A0A0D2PF70_HYPSF|nr:hypothetical protein HYPSUDRAFT_914066 [Hypholoma sublateritium FD-334 SS-4]
MRAIARLAPRCGCALIYALVYPRNPRRLQASFRIRVSSRIQACRGYGRYFLPHLLPPFSPSTRRPLRPRHRRSPRPSRGRSPSTALSECCPGKRLTSMRRPPQRAEIDRITG